MWRKIITFTILIILGPNFILKSEVKLDYPNCDYLFIIKHDDGSIALCFEIGHDKIYTLGDEMNEVNEDAYMNSHNWDAFINYYLAANAPDILKGMETDPDGDTYIAYYANGAKNEDNVKRLAAIIISLVENKHEIFKILREKGNEIKWN